MDSLQPASSLDQISRYHQDLESMKQANRDRDPTRMTADQRLEAVQTSAANVNRLFTGVQSIMSAAPLDFTLSEDAESHGNGSSLDVSSLMGSIVDRLEGVSFNHDGKVYLFNYATPTKIYSYVNNDVEEMALNDLEDEEKLQFLPKIENSISENLEKISRRLAAAGNKSSLNKVESLSEEEVETEDETDETDESAETFSDEDETPEDKINYLKKRLVKNVQALEDATKMLNAQEKVLNQTRQHYEEMIQDLKVKLKLEEGYHQIDQKDFQKEEKRLKEELFEKENQLSEAEKKVAAVEKKLGEKAIAIRKVQYDLLAEIQGHQDEKIKCTEETRAKQRELEDIKRESAENLNAVKAELESIKKELAEKNKEFKAKTQEIEATQVKMQDIQAMLAGVATKLSTQSKQVQAERDTALKEKSQLEQQCSELIKAREEQENQQKELQAKLSELEGQLAKAATVLQQAEAAAQQAASKAQQAATEAQEAAAAAENKLRAATAKIEELTRNKAELQDQLNSGAQVRAGLEQQVKNLNEQLIAANQQAQQNADAAQAAAQRAQANFQQVQRELQEAKQLNAKLLKDRKFTLGAGIACGAVISAIALGALGMIVYSIATGESIVIADYDTAAELNSVFNEYGAIGAAALSGIGLTLFGASWYRYRRLKAMKIDPVN